MRTDIIERKAEILRWIEENQSKAYMARQLGCNPKTIDAVLKRLDIEYAGNKSGKGFRKEKGKTNLEEYLATSIDI